MFFSISPKQCNNFALHWTVGKVCIDTDVGWKSHIINDRLFIYKGYTDRGKLEDQLSTTDADTLGNFCIIAIDQQQQLIQIITDRYRSFPLYYEDQGRVTNLEPLNNIVWTGRTIQSDFDLNITEYKVKPNPIGTFDSSELSYDAALDYVDGILKNKTQEFLNNNTLPLKVFLSGGVDTLLIYSYLIDAGADFEMVDYNHVDHDYFWRANEHLIQKNWGYSQIHHWRAPCVLASGTPGDEYMLRSPTTANMYLKRHGTSIPELLTEYPDCLHHSYFGLKKHQDIFQKQQHDPVASNFTIFNVLINDWQHWHLGNTLTWTPLRDLEIFKTLLRLPKQYAIGQIMNSDFSKSLIERNTPGATRFISDQKNTGPALKNLNKLFI